MEFIKICMAGIDGTATVPETALAHWQAYGWQRVDEATNEPATEEAPDKPPHKSTASRSARRSAVAEETTED